MVYKGIHRFTGIYEGLQRYTQVLQGYRKRVCMGVHTSKR